MTTHTHANPAANAHPATGPAVVIYEDTVASLRSDIEGLIPAHYEELAKRKDLMRLQPDWDKYKLIEDAGMLLALSAYVDDKLAGYSINIIDSHLHYSGLRYAQNDLLFLHKDYRTGSLGLRLIRETQIAARERGAGMMMWHAKPGTTLHKLLQLRAKRGRVQVQDIIYSEVL